MHARRPIRKALLVACWFASCGVGSSDGVPADVPDSGVPGEIAAPACHFESKAVDCGLALWLMTWWADGNTPRERCEAICAAGQADRLNAMECGDGAICSYCVGTSGLRCDLCGTLSDTPVTDFPCDDDPCTDDGCEDAHCDHQPKAWIGEACQVANDFGTCRGKFVCDASLCGPQDFCMGDEPRVCTAAVPGPDVANGTDDDCDGSTDEDPGPVWPLSEGGTAGWPDVAAGPVGIFAIAWQEGRQGQAGNRLMVRVGNRVEGVGGVPVVVSDADVQISNPRVFAFPSGRYGVAWTAGMGIGSVARVRLVQPSGALEDGPYDLHEANGPEESLEQAGGAAARPDETWIATWTSWSAKDNTQTLWTRHYVANPFVPKSPVPVSTGAAIVSPDVVALSGDGDVRYLIAWIGSAGTSPDAGAVWAVGADAYGAAATTPFRIDVPPADPVQAIDRISLATLADGRIAAAWSADGRVRVRLLSAAGDPAGGEIAVPGEGFATTFTGSVVALPSGGFAVAFQGRNDPAGCGDRVLERLFAADGKPSGPAAEVQVSDVGTNTGARAAALGNGGRVVVWIHGQGEGSACGAASGVRFRVYED